MELVLLFAGIIIFNIVVKRMQYKAQQDKRKVENSRSAQSAPKPLANSDTPKSLQDLIRKFNERQQESESASAPKTVEKETHSPAHEDTPSVLHEEETVIQTHREQWEARKKELSDAASALNTASNPRIESIAKPVIQKKAAIIPNHGITSFKLNITEAREGFLWAKVIDDPRFRRRSPLNVKAL
ncbi:MAG: hypothetical protein WCX75_00860 [Fibrobacteraceae bacterium]